MNVLHLFAGAGGGILADVLLGHQVVCAVERDPYRQAVLLARQADGCIPFFPIWSDVADFDGRPWRGVVDIIAAGFPCQPFSVAGKRRGKDDERNGWPHTIRIIREVGPRFALLENVPGLLADPYSRTIFGDLAEAGFNAEWGVYSAADVGFDQERRRVWIVANSDSDSVRSQRLRPATKKSWSREQFERLVQAKLRVSLPAGCTGGISDGVAHRVDRLAALGDGQVPIVAATAWRELSL